MPVVRFAYPEAFWLVPLLLLAVAALLWAHWRRRTIVQTWLGNSLSGDRPRLRLLLRSIGLVGLLLAISGPQASIVAPPEEIRNRQVLFLLDVSRSMLAADVPPSRLEAARQVIRQAATRLRGEQLGLVVFSNYAYGQCPLTTDESAFLQLLALADTRQFANHGTDFRSALLAAAAGFEEQRTQVASRTVVLLSDGEHHGEVFQSALTRLRRSGVNVVLVPIGTTSGAAVPSLRDSVAGEEIPELPGSTAGRTRLSDASFKVIQQNAGAHVVGFNSPAETGQQVAQFILQLPPRTATSADAAERWLELYPWPLALGLLLLALAVLLQPRTKPAT